ncbi:alanine transaminase, partial [Campylobacter sp. BCW_8712]
PAYPIHTQAFIIAGGNVAKMPLAYNEKFELDENQFFENLHKTLNESIPRPKYVVVNFPHNPTTVTCEKSFYERLIATAKKERFYIISDIAYADLTYDDYKTPSILEIEGAKDVAVETYTLSKSYNMAGWRVGFVVGNKRLVSALKKIKSWFDYGMYTPIQVSATIALDGDQTCVDEIRATYDKRMHILLEAFENAGWKLQKPRASMFVWAKLPESKRHLKSLEFSKQLLQRASVAVSPGVGFGEAGDEY